MFKTAPLAVSLLVAAALLSLAPLPRALASDSTFLAGADGSNIAYFEAHGKVYRDGGKPMDAFAIFKKHGVNCVRLRLFTSSDAQAKRDPYNFGANLHSMIPLAVRAKKAGLKLLLDFHYSDTWADPGHQATPSAWNALPFDGLERQMYDYNRVTIDAFRHAGAAPDYVQIGNETPGGLLWPVGRVGGPDDSPRQWKQLGRLMNAAVRGINQGAGANRPKIIVHLDRGGDWETTKWFFDHLTEVKVRFDMIGESYYPYWHGGFDRLRECLNGAAMRYHKPIVIAETDFPWNEADPFAKDGARIDGIRAGKAGQVQFAGVLGKILKEVPDGLGAGVFWWAAEYLPVAGVNLADFDGRSFFNGDGDALPVINAIGRLRK